MRSIIIGAGTYGQVYLAYLQEAGVDVIGFLDDDKSLFGQEVCGIPVLGGTDMLPILKESHKVEAIYCPIGSNRIRVKFLTQARELGYATPNYIHPSVIMSPHVKLGEGVYILLNSSIMPFTIISDFTMVSAGCKIAHHSIFEEGVFVSTGVNFGASMVAKKYAYIGIGATVMTGVKELGEDCLIGAGAVVIRDVPDKAVVAGVPAKIIKYKE